MNEERDGQLIMGKNVAQFSLFVSFSCSYYIKFKFSDDILKICKFMGSRLGSINEM